MTFDTQLAAAKSGSIDESHLADLADAALECWREADALPIVEGAASQLKSARLWQWTGLLYRALDRRAGALPAFEHAAQLAPHDAGIAHGHARVALEAGRPAVALFEKALRLAPSDGEVFLGLLAAMLASGRGDEALEMLDTTLAQSPAWIEGQNRRIQLAWMLGRGFSSFDVIRACIARFPIEPVLREVMILALAAAGDYSKTLAALEDGGQSLGDSDFFRLNRAIALSETGDLHQADRAFHDLNVQNHPDADLHKVRHHIRAGRPDQASSIIEKWLATPQANSFWPYAAIVWRLMGDDRYAWLTQQEGLVAAYDLEEYVPQLDPLRETLCGLHVARHENMDQSVRSGTQTDGALFSRIEPAIMSLRAEISAAVAKHISNLPPIDPRHPTLKQRRDRAPRFAGSWSVRLAASGFHSNHVHPNGWFSSAFYVALPDHGPEDGANAGWFALGQPQAGLMIELPVERFIEPKPGRLLLFPSFMWHGTVPFSVGERITVAFDVAPPGPPSG